MQEDFCPQALIFYNAAPVQLHLRQLLFAQQKHGGDQVHRHRKQPRGIVAAHALGYAGGAVQPADKHGGNVHGAVQEHRHPQIAGAEVDGGQHHAQRGCKHTLHQHAKGCRAEQIAQVRRMGKKRIIAETGAGQHGVATATVCALMNMECIVYMGKTDVERQHINVEKMKMLGATVTPVTSGNMTLKDATNEAIRDWCCHPADTYYIIGSTVGPHPYPDMVARLQSVISEEIKKQLQEKEGRDYPDYLIACVGGGSNAAGTIYHYINDERVGIVLAEAGGKGIETGMTAATIQLGKMGIIHGARTYVIQNEDGQIEEPYSISAGLDYPGIGPIHANLAAQRRANVLAINDDEAIEAAYELTKFEGIIPALESAHALGALKKLKFKPEDVVVLTVSGRGDKDIETYLSFNEEKQDN